MKDGFDKNVAEKMPKIQRSRPNRPWNVDPVLLKSDPAEPKAKPASPEAETQPALTLAKLPTDLRRAENAIEEIDTQFTHMIMEKKDVQRLLDQKQQEIEVVVRQNSALKETLTALQSQVDASTPANREMTFLHEQLQDAYFFIQNLSCQLDEKLKVLEEQQSLRLALEEKCHRMSHDLRGKAMLDVRASLFERDLTAAQMRIQELEGLLEEESRKLEPLEEEIAELNTTLYRVHSSLSHIRLKAKREAYGV